MIWTRMLTVSCAVAAVAAIAPGLQAAAVTQTYSGTFPAIISGTLSSQGTALEETFTLLSAGNVTIFTTSYATGGFEPNLMLYNSAGQELATSAIPGTSPIAAKDPGTGEAFDAYLAAGKLPAGTYTVALMDFLLGQSLTATNLSDGFNLNFGSGTTFVDEMGNARTGNYSLDITLASASATPEPSTVFLIAPLLAGLAIAGRKRWSQQKKHA